MDKITNFIILIILDLTHFFAEKFNICQDDQFKNIDFLYEFLLTWFYTGYSILKK